MAEDNPASNKASQGTTPSPLLADVRLKGTRMPFDLKEVAPWGRSLKEYVDMFALSDEDLRKPILGCGDGPASFNAELTKLGGTVVSIDPLYAFGEEEIRGRIDETCGEVMTQVRKNKNDFVWENIRSVEELGSLRMAAMREFLSDYPRGKAEGRYRPESAPVLHFPNRSFSLGLSSHFLFLYSNCLDLIFHIHTINELCRVCGEARLFPLLSLGGALSPHVGPVTEHFQTKGYEVQVIRVPYEFQRGGNKMMRIKQVEQCKGAYDFVAAPC